MDFENVFSLIVLWNHLILFLLCDSGREGANIKQLLVRKYFDS